MILYIDHFFLFSLNILVFYENIAKSEIIYTKFDPIFTDEEELEHLKLPIGHGCQRLQKLHEFYPKITSSYGKKFKFEHDVTFNHLELEGKNLTNCLECACCYNELKNFTTRSYSNKMFVDFNEKINDIETVDEYTNKKIRTIYETDKNTVHKLNLEDNRCLTYKLKSNHSLNYFYIQDLFVNRPEIFNTENKSYTYLGEYKIDNVDYLVVEKLFKKLLKLNRTSDQNGPFKCKNGILDTDLLVTHYYTRKDYYSDIRYKVPTKIEIELSGFSRLYYYGNMTIDMKTYRSNLEDYAKYDTTKCENAN